jgi:hypothetical protein
MAKHKRLSHDQKRKAKLAREARRARPQSSLAYHGNKYKTDELANVFFRTELGIYESWVMTDRELTDRDVEAALEKLVLQMRRGPLPAFADDTTAPVGAEATDLIIWNIRRNWHDLFQEEPRPSADKLMGVLRTLLSSVDTWSSPSPTSRGYLHFIEGFLKKAGATVTAYDPEGNPQAAPEADDLLAVGQAWCAGGDPTAAADFRALAETMIRTGEAERVVEVCQTLMGEAPAPDILAELSKLSLWAQQKLRPRRE